MAKKTPEDELAGKPKPTPKRKRKSAKVPQSPTKLALGVVASQPEVTEAYQVAFGGPTARTIARWLAAGAPGEPGNYNLLRIERWHSEGTATRASDEEDAARKKLEREIKEAQLEMVRAKVAEKKGEVMTIEEIDLRDSRRIEAVCARLDTFPRLAIHLEGKSIEEMEAILREYARLCRLSIAGESDDG